VNLEISGLERCEESIISMKQQMACGGEGQAAVSKDEPGDNLVGLQLTKKSVGVVIEELGGEMQAACYTR
jgi:hypothetical protein